MYKIVRHYLNGGKRTIKTGLTLKEAQEYCADPETSSRTCTLPDKKRITKRMGPWCDCFHECRK